MLESLWRKRIPHSRLVGCKFEQSCGRKYGGSSKHTRKEKPYDTAIPQLCTFLISLKILVSEDTCTGRFFVVLLTVVKKWKQPKSLLVGDWIMWS